MLTLDQKKVVEDNMPLAKNIARKLYNDNTSLFESSTITYEDIESIAFEALCKCTKCYDKTTGFCFSTYAYKYIYYYVYRHMFYEASLITVKKFQKSKSYQKMKEFIFNSNIFVNVDSEVFDGGSHVPLLVRDTIKDDSIEDTFSAIEDNDVLSKVISILTKQELDMIRHYYDPDLSWSQKEQYARSLGIGATAVKMRINKIIKKIKKSLNI